MDNEAAFRAGHKAAIKRVSRSEGVSYDCPPWEEADTKAFLADIPPNPHPEQVEAAVAAILSDVRDRRFLKWLFSENADTDLHPIGYVDGPIDLETQRECAETWVRLAFASLAKPVQHPGEVEKLREQIADAIRCHHRSRRRRLPNGMGEFRHEGEYNAADAILASLANRPADDGERQAIRAEIINTPETADFMAGVPIEAAHQRERWGSSHDGGKTPEDWFWLIGYLAQKALRAQNAGDTIKALHHTISTAAALGNWHAAITGADTTMRPGILPPQPEGVKRP